jgi:hypothetical protein
VAVEFDLFLLIDNSLSSRRKRKMILFLMLIFCSVLDGIIQLAYELAQLSNRSRPNVRDMIAACAHQGIEVHHLNELLSIQPAPDEGRPSNPYLCPHPSLYLSPE